jgi:hypothetical protein
MEAAGDLLDWVGENSFADDISEAEGRNLVPAAFLPLKIIRRARARAQSAARRDRRVIPWRYPG